MQDCCSSEDVLTLVKLIKKHKGKIVVYTGAGISTSASIPDYRGTNGLWTSNGHQSIAVERQCNFNQRLVINSNGGTNTVNKQNKRLNSIKSSLKLRLPQASIAVPTFTHMAIKVLVERGFVRHVISQNVDGLHLRSGLIREKLSELHGNLFIEQCIACGFNIFRSFDVAETTGRSQHFTGRICPQCTVSHPTECLLVRKILHNYVQKIVSCKQGLQTSREELMLCYRKAVRKLVRFYEPVRKGAEPQISIKSVDNKLFNYHSLLKTAPLLRDVVVHFFEKQPKMGLNEIYRVQAAIDAVHGRNSLNDKVNKTQIDSVLSNDEVRCKILKTNDLTCINNSSLSNQVSSISNTEQVKSDYLYGEVDVLSKDMNDPSSLIIVVGSSLSVLKNYHFLWPHGLGRCSHSNSRKRTFSKFGRSCSLVIINLQPTCKDGLADLIFRVPCDDLFRTLMVDHLGLDVPKYDAMKDDPLFSQGIPLDPHEEATRTRPDIPFMDF